MSRNAPPIVLSALALLALAAPLCADDAVAPGLLGGRVTSERDSPLPAASVYVVQLADAKLLKVATDLQGRFGFRELPAGLYKVVAFKPGFVPAVVMLTRATATMRQFVDLELAADVPTRATAGDFWSLRGQIPADVLREIGTELAAAEPEPSSALAAKAAFSAEMEAVAGVDTVLGEATQVTGAGVGIRGAVGSYAIGLTGNYRQIDRPAVLASGSAGESRLLSLRLENADSTAVGLSGFSNRLAFGDDELADPIDFERYQVSWSQRLGAAGHSHFAAQYIAESNYYRQSWIDLVGLPSASQTWALEGSYSVSPTERSTLETGMRYRVRDTEIDAHGVRRLFLGEALPQENMAVWARGGYRLQPAFLVEYGLYSTLADGTLSLMPQGGVVVQMGDEWQAGASAARRVYDETVEARRDFVPTFFGDAEDESPERAAYRVFLSRQGEEDSALELSAGRRELAETIRLFFSDDVLNHLESLYLVPGDRLHEAGIKVTRRVTPDVLATLSSTLAAGGGGHFLASKAAPFENDVRYVVTSLDTQFQRTSTGVFVAFHRLEQQLRSTTPSTRPVASPEARFERLQVLLSQDLDVLVDLAADWAVQLDLELSRGALPTAGIAEDALRKQVMGGFSVSF